MELIDLYEQQDKIIDAILFEWFHDTTVPGLCEEIEIYTQNTRNYAADLRQSGQLTHKGRPVKTKPDLKRICINEGWQYLFKDMEDKNDVRL